MCEIREYTSTDLFKAIVAGDENEVRRIISANINLVNAKNLLGRSPLHLDLNRKKLRIAKILLDSSPILDTSDIDCETALHAACMIPDYYLTSILLQRGANCRVRNVKGRTPLHSAFSSDDSDIIRLLMKSEFSSMFVVDVFGRLPWCYLSYHHNGGCKLLLENISSHGKN